MFMFSSQGRGFSRASFVARDTFEFRDKVLRWELDSILNEEENLDCTPRLATYSDSWSYYNSLQPLIIAEARTMLKEGLELYYQGRIKNSTLVVGNIKRRANNPQMLQMVGSISGFDPKLDTVLLKNMLTGQMFFGQLSMRDQDIYGRNVEIKCSSSREIDSDCEFEVCQLCSLVTLNRAYEVCVKRPKLRFEENLLATNFTHNSKLSPIGLLDGDFNIAQKEAISSFLNLETGLQLLQGPPGTGKTTTINFLLENLVANGERILVCAPSNKAVQVIAKRFLTKNPNTIMFFAGREEKLDPELETIFLDNWKANILKELEELELRLKEIINLLEFQLERVHILPSDLSLIRDSVTPMYNQLQDILYRLIRYEVNSYAQSDSLKLAEKYELFAKNQQQVFDLKIELQNLKDVDQLLINLRNRLANISDIDEHLLRISKVVFCTLSFAGQQRMSNIRITSLIVDEAAQATEADTIIPLQHNPRKCLLVGDTNQLPAVVKSEIAKANNYGWSMMHRLQVEAGFPYKMLNIQYRMDPLIRSWPSKEFYKDRLEDSVDIAKRERLSLPKQICPYAFIDVKGKETTLYNSKKNDEEADLVIKLLRYLQKAGFSLSEGIGIITFYSGQVETINRKLSDARLDDIKAQTVDGFQGDEKEIIIISFVRANKSNSVGFLNDFRRLNVAVTRARGALIMVGDSQTLAMDPTLGSMINHILQTKSLHKASYVEQEILSKLNQALTIAPRPYSNQAALQKSDWRAFKQDPSFLPQASQQSWRQPKPLVKETRDEKANLTSFAQSSYVAASNIQKTKPTLGYKQPTSQPKEAWPKLSNKTPEIQSKSQQLWGGFAQSRNEKEESREKNEFLSELRPSSMSDRDLKPRPAQSSQQLEEWPKLKNNKQ